MTITRAQFVAVVASLCGFTLLGWLPPVLLVAVVGMPFDTAVLCCTYMAALFALLLLSVRGTAQTRGNNHAAEKGDAD